MKALVWSINRCSGEPLEAVHRVRSMADWWRVLRFKDRAQSVFMQTAWLCGHNHGRAGNSLSGEREEGKVRGHGYEFRAVLMVSSVINRARTAVFSLTHWHSVEFNEAWRGMKWWNEIKPLSARYGWNIEYEPPSAKLLSIAPDAASTMDGYGWQGQWLFDEDDDAFHIFVTWLKPIGITAAENKRTAFQIT